MRATSGVAVRAAVAVGALLTLVLAGCGKGSSTADGPKSPAPKVSQDTALAAKVPANIRKLGTVTVGTDSSYAPSEFLAKDGSTVEGFDIDLFTSVLKKLGLKAEYQSADFDTIIAGVESGKYTVGVSSFTVNADREKQANMVSYFSAGILWATKKGNPDKIDPSNACGKKVAVQTGTVEADDLVTLNKKCPAGNKIKIDSYKDQDQATAAVVSGKEQAMSADSPVVAYAVKQTKGQLQSVGGIYEAAPYGYVIKKDQLAFAQAIQSALKVLIADGTYEKILTNWGVQAGKITNPTVNPSAS